VKLGEILHETYTDAQKKLQGPPILRGDPVRIFRGLISMTHTVPVLNIQKLVKCYLYLVFSLITYVLGSYLFIVSIRLVLILTISLLQIVDFFSFN
jgi:hypothetical protein